MKNKEYKHPFFVHDETGNLERLKAPEFIEFTAIEQLDYFVANGHFPKIKFIITEPLTEAKINTNFIEVLNRYGYGDRLVNFLDRQYQHYYISLPADKSINPFFDYLLNLLQQNLSAILLITYDTCLNWMRSYVNILYSSINQSISVDIPSLPLGFPKQMKSAALWYTYQGIDFGKASKKKTAMEKIIRELGLSSATSDSQLARHFVSINSETKRREPRGRAAKDLIRQINSIIDFLPDDAKKLADGDIKALRLRS